MSDYYDDYPGLSPVIETDIDYMKDEAAAEYAQSLGLNPDLIDLSQLDKYEEALDLGIGTFYLECGLVDLDNLEEFDEMKIKLVPENE